MNFDLPLTLTGDLCQAGAEEGSGGPGTAAAQRLIRDPPATYSRRAAQERPDRTDDCEWAETPERERETTPECRPLKGKLPFQQTAIWVAQLRS